jgi:hypothetical protein
MVPQDPSFIFIFMRAERALIAIARCAGGKTYYKATYSLFVIIKKSKEAS